ncbi:hypothetical protein NL676_025293 [Syzygium grande]|nr:hypothetical protein NL676_025293 [Syzygium grande]
MEDLVSQLQSHVLSSWHLAAMAVVVDGISSSRQLRQLHLQLRSHGGPRFAAPISYLEFMAPCSHGCRGGRDLEHQIPTMAASKECHELQS